MPKSKGGLTKWFKEDWVDIKTGKKCGQNESNTLLPHQVVVDEPLKKLDISKIICYNKPVVSNFRGKHESRA